MMAGFAKELWRVYPNCRLHVEVTEAGVNSYKVIVKLLDADRKLLHSLEHFGTGDLFELKHAAIQAMIHHALTAPTA